MSSNPPGKCCYHGVKHEGEAVGRYEKTEDFETYISEAPDKSTENGILLHVNSPSTTVPTMLTGSASQTLSDIDSTMFS